MLPIAGYSDYEIEAWLSRLGSPPVECLKVADLSASYEMTKCGILRLLNGQFATVVEEGCSCYSSSDADIELHPTYEAAWVSFQKWYKSRTRGND